MAAVTHAVSLTDTANNQPSYTTGSFTPSVGDLLVVFVFTAAAVATDGSVSLSSGTPESLSFALVVSATRGTALDKVFAFIGNQFVSASGARTLTFDCGDDDTATGCMIIAARVSGMTLSGASAIRQFAVQSDQPAGTPAPSFAAAALTGNPTIGFVGNATNPAGLTPPTSWTELADVGFATPDRGSEYAHRDSGFTGQTITWGSASASGFCLIALELDASAGAGSSPSAGVMTLAGPVTSLGFGILMPDEL
jgi:hypothetical protein